MNKKMSSIIGVGTASILMIFVVISLISLGVLTFSSAKADERLSEKSIQHVEEYYVAFNLANEKLTQIDRILSQNYEKEGTYSDRVFDLLPEWIEVVESQEYTALKYTQEINSNQFIDVEVRMCYPQKDTDTFYAIHKFKTVTSENWQGNQQLPVYTNE